MITLSTTSPPCPAAPSGSLDEVIRLRQWGTDLIYLLPPIPERSLVGTSAACALRLVDRQVAPDHAELIHERQRWRIRGLESATPLRRDGEPCHEIILTPGVEVGIGGTTLIAESARSIALREFCARILGSGGDRKTAVDHALRAIRLAAMQRSALLLRGEGDMVPIAHALHRHVLGDDAPFIVCDPRRRNGSASARSPGNHVSGVVAYQEAVGGSLCLRASRLPRDAPLLLGLINEPDRRVQLIVCVGRRARSSVLTDPMPIEVPSLALREAELPRIVDEYASEALAALGAPSACFTEEDRSWVIAHAGRSLPEIEKATLRLVALNASASVCGAAALLAMAPVSLARWMERRTLPASARKTFEDPYRKVATLTSSQSAPPDQPRQPALPRSRFCWRCENRLETAPHVLVNALFGEVWVHAKCREQMIRDGEIEEGVGGSAGTRVSLGRSESMPSRRALRTGAS
jgi:hypothetical protein